VTRRREAAMANHEDLEDLGGEVNDPALKTCLQRTSGSVFNCSLATPRIA